MLPVAARTPGEPHTTPDDALAGEKVSLLDNKVISPTVYISSFLTSGTVKTLNGVNDDRTKAAPSKGGEW